VRRGELREWAREVEHVMRTPIDAPDLWKVGSLTVVISAVFYGLTLIPIYVPRNAPSPSLWAIIPAAFMFALGVITFLFTLHLEKNTKRMNTDRAEMLANKIRHADARTSGGQAE
jgi:hypothetical protein